MQLVIRYFTQEDLEQAAAGELHIRRQRGDRGERALAELVLDEGPEALPQGAGPIERIVVTASPTLDEALAAEFVRRRLAGEEIPAGCRAFARYATLAREGLKPGEVPLECSLEGIYLAILNAVAEDLSTPRAAEQFASDWRRLAERIIAAAKDGIDPFHEPFLGEGPDFAREQSFLRHDRDVFRHDVARGESWIVALPGGPPEAHGLLLRNPKSLLFKYWSRDPGGAPEGKCNLFLAVDWGGGKWVFSTDPVQRLSLLGLAEALQAAEQVSDPAAAEADPWFDGAPFGNTLVAAPNAGTRLTEEQVLQIVREWCGARLAAARIAQRPRRGNRRVLGVATAAVAALVGCVLVGAWYWRTPAPDARGLYIPEEEWRAAPGPRQGKDYALLIATDHYSHWLDLPNPTQDAGAIAQLLHDVYGFEVDPLFNPTKTEILKKLQSLTEPNRFGLADQVLIFVAGHGDRLNKEGYVVASNSKDIESDPTRESLIPHSQVRDLAEKIDCGHVLVVLDVCFGGTFDFGIASGGTRGGTYQKVSKQEFISRKMGCKSALWLTSGAGTPVPDGDPGQHSPFARDLIEALENKGGRDGIVTFHELLVQVEESQLSDPRNGQLRGNQAGGDFLFISH